MCNTSQQSFSDSVRRTNYKYTLSYRPACRSPTKAGISPGNALQFQVGVTQSAFISWEIPDPLPSNPRSSGMTAHFFYSRSKGRLDCNLFRLYVEARTYNPTLSYRTAWARAWEIRYLPGVTPEIPAWSVGVIQPLFISLGILPVGREPHATTARRPG
jgi:hypothetical protein